MRRGFTLVEIMIAVAILAGALLVLVQSQASAVLMTRETENLLAATLLAREKMAEVQLAVESEGFGEQDIEEEGDFENFGDAEGLDLGLELDEVYEDFHWAYTVRKIELELGGDLTGMAEGLAGQGYWGEQDAETQSQAQEKAEQSGQEVPGLDDMGVSSDMVTDLLGGYIREVRVLVWWGDNEDELDQVEIVTHVINSSALSAISAALGGGGQRTSRTSRGGGGGKSGQGGQGGKDGGKDGGGNGGSSGGAMPMFPGRDK
jgi:prepilin-type N-terminal cleavage/methylation domain-containing protein